MYMDYFTYEAEYADFVTDNVSLFFEFHLYVPTEGLNVSNILLNIASHVFKPGKMLNRTDKCNVAHQKGGNFF